MRITNKYGLSRSRVNLAYHQMQRPTENILRATELIDAPRMRMLKLRHWDEIVIDCTDVGANSIYGSMKHLLVAGAVDSGYLSEVKLKWWTNEDIIEWISGTPDLYDKESQIIEDNKWTKTWKQVYRWEDDGDQFRDWEEQLNVYAWLLRKVMALDTNQLVINVSWMDWTAYRVDPNKNNYPQRPDERKIMSLWDNNKQQLYVLDRLHRHISATHKDNTPLPLCTATERWAKKDKWAVMKKGRKSALSVVLSEQNANEILEKTPEATSIEYRKGADKRCVDYCIVNQFCDYWRDTYAKD